MARFTNTLTGKKEDLIVSHNKVSMYICGITPYADAHIGHGRCYVAFDLLYRFLKCGGYEVIYCRNFTDIDDKLLHKAEQEFGDRLRFREIADRYIQSFADDMVALNCQKPQHEPRVTDVIPFIVDFIQELINNGSAYQSGGDVYFDIVTFPDYGKLSKQKIEDLHAGVRTGVRENKKNPLDFALWKHEPDGEFWSSPWGWGRPGWHIECSVMARQFLGKHITIHGGGSDLIFPHHENEIAQTEALYGAPFAQLWMHNGFVMMGSEKMSKSLGNVLSLNELCKRYDPMVVRYYYLTHHYKAPIEFSSEGIDAAQKSYARLCRLFGDYGDEGEKYSFDLISTNSIAKRMLEFLSDDLNSPGLFGVLFESISEITNNKNDRDTVAYILKHVLGLTLTEISKEEAVIVTPEIQRIIDERAIARKQKNWARADQLRSQLEAMNIIVRDEKI